jgi:lambda repressor-like predicted transcriptional regulator
MTKFSRQSESPTPEQIRGLRVRTRISVPSAIAAAGLKTRLSWFKYERGTSIMPPERWKRVLDAVKKGEYKTTSGPHAPVQEQPPTKGVNHSLRRCSPEEMAVMRASYLALIQRLGSSMRELAGHSGLSAITIGAQFARHLPRTETYSALYTAMRARLEEIGVSVRAIEASGDVIDGNMLGTIRQSVGLTQAEMAPILGHAGKDSRITVSEYERGVSTLKAERTAKLLGLIRQRYEEACDPKLWSAVFGAIEP